MKRALVTGVTGQDGAYLSQLLLKKGYKVYGSRRRSSSANTWRLQEMGIDREIEFVDMELLEFENLRRALDKVQPDEVYNLAAQSFVGSSFEMPCYTGQVTGMAVCALLDALRPLQGVRFYQASTSELYGKVKVSPQTEDTPFHPRSPYAVAKLYAHWITVNYRESYGMFASAGLLFNHESPYRGFEFVTRKLTSGLASLMHGKGGPVRLGNLEARRDWGFAGDYVDAIWRIMNHKEPDDFVIATGETHSVRSFIEAACKELDLRLCWEGEGVNEFAVDQSGRRIVEVDSKFFRPAEVDVLIGDASKAKRLLGWESRTSFEELVRMMTRADYDRIAKDMTLS